MKTFVSANLRAHMKGGTLTIAWYLVLVRKDGAAFGFVTHVEDCVVPSLLSGVPGLIGYPLGCVACVARGGFEPTDIQITDTLAPNNLDITALLGADGINERDVRAGKWKNAAVEIGMFNFSRMTKPAGYFLAYPTDGTDPVIVGTVGDITFGDLTAKMEVRGISQALDQNLDGMISDNCTVRLGSARCGVNLAPYTKTGTIGSVTADHAFVDVARTEADGYFTKGEVTFTSGAAAGQTYEVKTSLATGVITLADEVFPGIAAGDAYRIVAGCNHLLWDATGAPTGDCKVKFSNAIRFTGYRPPGMIAITQYGGQGGS